MVAYYVHFAELDMTAQGPGQWRIRSPKSSPFAVKKTKDFTESSKEVLSDFFWSVFQL